MEMGFTRKFIRVMMCVYSVDQVSFRWETANSGGDYISWSHLSLRVCGEGRIRARVISDGQRELNSSGNCFLFTALRGIRKTRWSLCFFIGRSNGDLLLFSARYKDGGFMDLHFRWDYSSLCLYISFSVPARSPVGGLRAMV